MLLHLVLLRRTVRPDQLCQLLLVQRLVAAHQRQHRPAVAHDQDGLEQEVGGHLQEPGHLVDGPALRRCHFLKRPVRELRRLRHGKRKFHVRRIPAPVAERHIVLARRRRRHVLVRHGPAHHARVALDHVELDAAAGIDLLVCFEVQFVGLVQARLVPVEAVGVLHGELARTQDAALGPRLVPQLGLDLVPDLRQVPVGADVVRREPGHGLLVRHGKAHVPLAAVLQPEHLVADGVPAAGLLPDLGRVQHRHGHFLAADGVHLLADDLVDLVHHPLAQGKVDVQPGRKLAHVARPHHELVRDRLGVGRDLLQGRDEEMRIAHE